jgi:hypothetical protein
MGFSGAGQSGASAAPVDVGMLTRGLRELGIRPATREDHDVDQPVRDRGRPVQSYIVLTMLSVIFLASPKSIIVLSR